MPPPTDILRFDLGDVRPWVSPDPKIRKAHDVRRLQSCCFCNGLGFNLVNLDAQKHGHVYCLVTARGINDLQFLPAVELAKATVSEITALGLDSSFLEYYEGVAASELVSAQPYHHLRKPAS